VPAEHRVEFYWRPGCPFCSRLRRRLTRRGIPFEPVNIWQDPAAAARVRDAAGGNETVPTVFVDGHSLVNPSLGQLEALIATQAPELLAALPPRRSVFGWRR
jgi:mycoredoxin